MEPNQNANMQSAASAPTSIGVSNVSSTSLNMPDKSVESSKPGSDVVFQDKPKKSHGMLYGMILLAILAAGGIGFGVWAMMDGNSQVAKKDEQIADLRSQLAEKSEVVEEDDSITVDAETSNSEGIYRNPVIKFANSGEGFRIPFQASVTVEDEGANTIMLTIKDGSVEECEFGRRTYGVNASGYSTTILGECSVTGLEGDIYDVVQFGAGQTDLSIRIGFIMSDGSVKYTLPIREAIGNNDLSIKGSLKIGGMVTNAIDVKVANLERGYGGYVTTVFVLSDGSYVKYNDSML